jgi:hypothetical protein
MKKDALFLDWGSQKQLHEGVPQKQIYKGIRQEWILAWVHMNKDAQVLEQVYQTRRGEEAEIDEWAP